MGTCPVQDTRVHLLPACPGHRWAPDTRPVSVSKRRDRPPYSPLSPLSPIPVYPPLSPVIPLYHPLSPAAPMVAYPPSRRAALPRSCVATTAASHFPRRQGRAAPPVPPPGTREGGGGGGHLARYSAAKPRHRSPHSCLCGPRAAGGVPVRAEYRDAVRPGLD